MTIDPAYHDVTVWNCAVTDTVSDSIAVDVVERAAYYFYLPW
jgi:hypothetical protein